MYGGEIIMEIFLAYLIQYWIFAQNISVDQSLQTTSPGAWREVSSTKDHCLMLRSALKHEVYSELTIFKKKIDTSCIESITSRPVTNLHIDKLDKLENKNGQFVMNFTKDNKSEAIKFPLWGQNVQGERLAYIGDIRSLSTEFLDLGMQCEDDCERCPKGFMRVVSTDGIKKVCLDNSLCGQKNQPGCFLGIDRIKNDNHCKDESKAVWCEGELKSVCSKELEYLVCE